MSGSKSVTNPSMPPAYILQFVVLTLVFVGLYVAAPWGIAIAISGPVQWGDLFRTAVPAVKHSVMWDGRLCVPMAEMQMFNPTMMSHTLVLVDLKTNQSESVRTRIPPGPLTLVPDGKVLWCLSGSTVYRIENGSVTPFGTGTTLKNQDSAFLYEGRLAVVEEVHNLLDDTSQFKLLTWTGAGWQDRGQILLPRPMDDESGGGDEADQDENVTALKAFDGPLEIRVLNDHGQLHLFCSDGTTVLYSRQMEVVPDDIASALAADNAASLLPGWIPVGLHSDFQVGLDAQGVLLLNQDSDFRNGGFSTQFTLKRLVEGKWTQDRQWDRKGFTIEPQLVWDGNRAWIVSQTLANKLLLTEITATGANESKLPVIAGATLDRLSRAVQDHSWWAPLPILLAYGFAASWLMARYRNCTYEFGNATVELAPFHRRTLAKMVDWMASMVPLLIAQRIAIGTQSDVQEWLTDQFMTFDLNVMKTALLIGLAVVLYCLAWLIGLGVMEGRWGISPGKWLLGLRVVRTTLRPCGFFRAAAREFLLTVDALFCMGWLPGALCTGLTANWQRLGDIVADTIVIRKPGTERSPVDDVVILDDQM